MPGEFEGFNAKDNEPDDYPFALAAIVTTSGEALTLQCRAEADVDQVEVRNGTLVAPKVG